MRDITLERGAVNVAALDAELKATLGSLVLGVSATRQQVTAHLADAATPEQQRQARALLVAHDASRLTPEQLARQRRTQQLAAQREANAAPLTPEQFRDAPAEVQRLAARLMWLEEELRDLRGGP